MIVVQKNINGTWYAFPKDVWENYFHEIGVIFKKDANTSIVDMGASGRHEIGIPIKKVVQMVNNYDEKLIEELFIGRPSALHQFLMIMPPRRQHFRFKKRNLFQLLFDSK